MKNLLFFILLFFFCSTAQAQTNFQVTSDPALYTVSFDRVHWVESLGGFLVGYGNSTSATGDNSVRFYSPTTNAWTTISPNEQLTKCCTNPHMRDNHASFYVPARDEFWIWGGSHMETVDDPKYGGSGPSGGDAVRSGRLSLAKCHPVTTNCGVWAAVGKTSTGEGVAFAGVIKNWGGFLIDPAASWNAATNTGMIGFGDDGGSPSARYWVIEPNTGAAAACGAHTGSEPYVMCEILGGTAGTDKPSVRAQCMNCLVTVGSKMYLTAGSLVGSVPVVNLWVYDIPTRVWTRLADPPTAGYQSVVTADTDMNLIVTQGSAGDGGFLIAYDIARNVWGNRSDFASVQLGSPTFNGIGVYAPTIKKHLYYGGNFWPGGASPGTNISGVSLSGGTLAGQYVHAPRLLVSRPYPPARADSRTQVIGESGYGPSVFGSGGKHQRVWYRQGKMYFFSGDYSGSPIGGLRTEVFSYNLTNPTSSQCTSFGNAGGCADYTNWVLEWPDCGLSGELSPMGYDETPWLYDVSRDLFWLPSGASGNANADVIGYCNAGGIKGIYFGNNASSNPATYPGNPFVATFNPNTRRWAQAPPQFQVSPTNTRHGDYNPNTDEMMLMVGSGNSRIAHQSLSTGGGWTTPEPAVDEVDGHYINDMSNYNEQPAVDVQRQYMYFIDTAYKAAPKDGVPGQNFRLIRYNMKAHSMRDLGWIPLPYSSALPEPNFGDSPRNCSRTTFPYYTPPYDSTMLVFDSVNNKVIWPAASNLGRPIILTYSPGTGTWTIDPMLKDRPSEIAWGSNGTYAPALNVTMMYGGEEGHDVDNCAKVPAPTTVQNYFWLYRTDGAVATQATITVINPTGAAISVSAADIFGNTSATTTFSRVYTIADMKTVDLVAAGLNGAKNPFSDWGGPCGLILTTTVANDTCRVLATSDKTFTPNYTAGAPATRTLTINSTNATGVTMALSPADLKSTTTCVTPCTLSYNDGQSVVVTAPLTSGSASYTLWSGPNSAACNAATVLMSTDKAISAGYASGTTYQNSVDFSNCQGQRNWSYLYLAGGVFNPMTFGAPGRWAGPEGSLLIMPGGLSHPGPSMDSALRWASPLIGNVRVRGTVADGDSNGGDGVDVFIKRDDVTIFSTSIANGNTTGVPYDLTVPVVVGTRLDFIVNRKESPFYDTTLFDPLIDLSAPSVRFGTNVNIGAKIVFGE